MSNWPGRQLLLRAYGPKGGVQKHFIRNGKNVYLYIGFEKGLKYFVNIMRHM